MDRLQALKQPTQKPRPRAAAATTATNTTTTLAKTRRKHGHRRKKNIFFCPQEQTYICQQTLLHLLHAHSFHSLHPVRRNDAERSIEFDYAWSPPRSYRLDLGHLLLQLSYSRDLAAQRPYLDAVQQSLVNALHLLHARNISFPLEPDRVEFARSCDAKQGDLQSLKLFLPFNKKARWASSALPPTWKADQLASATSILRVPLVRNRTPTVSLVPHAPLTVPRPTVARSTRCRPHAHTTRSRKPAAPRCSHQGTTKSSARQAVSWHLSYHDRACS
ncbi:hypothetical protein F5Y18DRAFT_2394 [Xylariaceae sp. FL1019]|nr:hypothetical protein F5Y18DRAFT_2394 [Xylariaceae sp. FL1019]